MTTHTPHYQNHILYTTLIITTILIITTPKTESTSNNNSNNSKSIYQVLESNGLPSGLFPKGITNYTINEDDGSFKVYLDQACDAKFESELHYETNVTGKLIYGQIGNLSGMSAQDLFLWFPVKGIRVDIPSSGVIYFDVGVVRKQFSVSLFETPRDCVATTHPLYAFSNPLSKKLGGMLRYSMNWWWKNEGELF